MRSFGIVDDKTEEAEFFLAQLTRCNNFFEARCYSVAFAAATRSITFALQASLRDLPGFNDWYAAKQAQLKTDSLARFFHDFRRVSHHIGEHLIGGGSFSGGEMLFYFTPVPDLPTVPDADVVTASRSFFVTLVEIVFDCYIRFAPHIDAHHHYTPEHYASIGRTIEDAEEELGYPRGWTDTGVETDTSWRWQALRNTVSGCTLQRIFQEYLGRTFPAPNEPNVA